MAYPLVRGGVRHRDRYRPSSLDGDDDHAVLVSPGSLGDPPATAELRGFRITGGLAFTVMNVGYAIYIAADATLTLMDCSVSDSGGDGIVNQGATLTLLNSTVSENGFTNVRNFDENGTLTVVNSTISGGQVGISNSAQTTVSHSTIASDGIAFETPGESQDPPPAATFANSIVEGACDGDGANYVVSKGYNIESPGDTCGFDQLSDRVDVMEEELNLGPLQNNGGPTETHEPGGGEFGTESIAIDPIPAAGCVDQKGAPLTMDQRGEPRPVAIVGPESCDVGSVEVQP